MARQCHLNTCPVGIATQNEELRKRFPGAPEHAVQFFAYVAQEVREILAEMGYRSLDEITGRSDLLKKRERRMRRAGSVEIDWLLEPPGYEWQPGRPAGRAERPEDGPLLDDSVYEMFAPSLQDRKPRRAIFTISNRERTVGARLSGEIARFHGAEGLPPATVVARFEGVAGQSFGAFLSPGMSFELVGEAQDYLGKGMAGGVLVVRPPRPTEPDLIAGNTVLYGATGGGVYIAGRVGERFAVRNSGARAVVEGVGDHACEYMTGGAVVVLGRTGRNFAAGMTGGVAYVYDPQSEFPEKYNSTLVKISRLTSGVDEELVKEMIERHLELTGSRRAAEIIGSWKSSRADFWKIEPRSLPEGVLPGDAEKILLDAVRAEASMEEGVILAPGGSDD